MDATWEQKIDMQYEKNASTQKLWVLIWNN
jgi:hypothetical protein